VEYTDSYHRNPWAQSAVGVKDGYRLDVTPLGFYSVVHQREEVVQHMPDNSYGTLEVVGR
jgi:hypothetical protein